MKKIQVDFYNWINFYLFDKILGIFKEKFFNDPHF